MFSGLHPISPAMHVRRLALLGLVLTGCGGSPTEPSPPPAACATNNTAVVYFQNDSRTTTQDHFWNGLKVVTLPPGTQSPAQTVPAGVSHRWEARVTNTSVGACLPATPSFSQCSVMTLACAFP